MKIVALLFNLLFCLASSASSHASEWRFHKDPGYSDTLPTDWVSIDNPGGLQSADIPPEGETYWIQTNLTLDANFNQGVAKSLQIGLHPCADQVFWDGDLIGSSGFTMNATPGTKQKIRSYFLPGSSLSEGQHQVMMKIYKHPDDERKIFSLQPRIIDFFTAETMKDKDYMKTFDLPLLCVIILFWIGCYFFLFFWFHRSFRQFLYFSFSCSLVSLFLFFYSWKLQELGVPSLFSLKISVVAAVWAVFFLKRFFQTHLNYPHFKHMQSPEIALNIFISLGIWLWHSVRVEVFFPVWLVLLLYNFSYLSIHATRAILSQKKFKDVLALAGYLIGVVIMSYDIYFFLSSSGKPLITPYVFVFFALGMAFWLTRDYGSALSDRNRQGDLRKRTQELETSFHMDSLTKVNNRRSFEMFMKDQLFKDPSYICLAIVDVDHFKLYNDSYGHPAGDRLLVSLGWLFDRWRNQTDSVYRIGGEEFVVIMKIRDPQSCFNQIQRLRTLVESFPFDNLNGNGKHVTVSIGAALLTKEMADPDTLYALADQRLYEAKKNRNTVVFPDAIHLH